MQLEVVMKTARSITFRCLDGGYYNTLQPYQIELNGTYVITIQQVVFTLYNLKPDTSYEVIVKTGIGEIITQLEVQTNHESVTLNVRDLGAKGDGRSDDTIFLQAAILACPKDGRVWIPAGRYRIISLFLKSQISIELDENVVLIADADPNKRPIFPGMTQSYDEHEEYNLGSWEGNPLSMYTGVITGIDVEDVTIYGRGGMDGGATFENWWKNPKQQKDAFRPRLIFLNRCQNIHIEGITLQNSPSWTLHPYFSNHLLFTNLMIQNPKDSPNTDGINPESCFDVRIMGVHFDVGDDCIAIKSGKIYMGTKYHTPSKNILISHCKMENGHGAVTIGSEMAGGIDEVTVTSCTFQNTDRGLRIKTRRGRGQYGVIDEITFQNVEMKNVLTPVAINGFYRCDPDGESDYVQSRACYPVDERTPTIGRLRFEHICCESCHVAGIYIEGLPEKKIQELVFHDLTIRFDSQANSGYPIMSTTTPLCQRLGSFISNVEKVFMSEVTIENFVGEPYLWNGVDMIVLK